jgi:hypothetical protein
MSRSTRTFRPPRPRGCQSTAWSPARSSRRSYRLHPRRRLQPRRPHPRTRTCTSSRLATARSCCTSPPAYRSCTASHPACRPAAAAGAAARTAARRSST